MTSLLSTMKYFGACEHFQKVLSDCNTRQTSIKEAERSKSMTGEKGHLRFQHSGTSWLQSWTKTLLRSNSTRSSVAGARFSQSTSTSVFVRVDSSITMWLCNLSGWRMLCNRGGFDHLTTNELSSEKLSCNRGRKWERMGSLWSSLSTMPLKESKFSDGGRGGGHT